MIDHPRYSITCNCCWLLVGESNSRHSSPWLVIMTSQSAGDVSAGPGVDLCFATNMVASLLSKNNRLNGLEQKTELVLCDMTFIDLWIIFKIKQSHTSKQLVRI